MPPAWKEKLYTEVNVTEGDDEELIKWKLRLAGAPPSRPPAPPADNAGGDDPTAQQGGAAGGGKGSKGSKQGGGGDGYGEEGGGQQARGNKAAGKPPPPPPPPSGGKAGARPRPPSAPARPSEAGSATGAARKGLKGKAAGGDGDARKAGDEPAAVEDKAASRRAAAAAAAPGSGGPDLAQAKAAGRSAAGEALRLFQNKGRSVALFQDAGFNPDAFIDSYLSGLSAKAVEGAAQELGALNEYCKQEILTSVHKHHKAFLEASLAIPELDQTVAELRVCVQGAEAVALTLEKARALSAGKRGSSGGGAGASPSPLGGSGQTAAAGTRLRGGLSEEEEAQAQAVAELIADLDVVVAEQDVAAATTVLRAGRLMVQVLERDQAINQQQPTALGMALRDQLEAVLEAKRLALVSLLQSQLAVASSSTAEVRTAASQLAVLAGDCTAATALLSCHSLKLHDMSQALLKYHSAAGEEDNLQYAGSLAQKTFLQIGRAVDDLAAVFGDGCREVYALLLQWAMREAHTFSRAVVQNALVPLSSSSEDLQDVSHCVAVVLACCLVLELDHGLSLVDEVQPELWGHLEGVLRKRLTRLVAELYTQAAEDARKLLADHAFQGQMSTVMWGRDFANGALPGDSAGHAAVAGSTGGMGRAATPGGQALPAVALAASKQLLAEVQTLVHVLLPLASLSGPAIGGLLTPWLTDAIVALCAGCNSGLERAAAGDPGAASGIGAPGPGRLLTGGLLAAGSAAAQQLPDLIHELRESLLDMLEDVQSAMKPLAQTALGAASFLAAPERLQKLIGGLGQRVLDLAAQAPSGAPSQQQQMQRQMLQRVNGVLAGERDEPSGPGPTPFAASGVGGPAANGRSQGPGRSAGNAAYHSGTDSEREAAEADVRLPGPPAGAAAWGAGAAAATGAGAAVRGTGLQRPPHPGSSGDESVEADVGPSTRPAALPAPALVSMGRSGAGAAVTAGAARPQPGQRPSRPGLAARRGLTSAEISSDESEGPAATGAGKAAAGFRAGRRTGTSVPSTTPRASTPLGSDSSDDGAPIPAWQARRMALRAQRAGGGIGEASGSAAGATGAGAALPPPRAPLSSRPSAGSVATAAAAARSSAATPTATDVLPGQPPAAAYAARPRPGVPPNIPATAGALRRPAVSAEISGSDDDDGSTARAATASVVGAARLGPGARGAAVAGTLEPGAARAGVQSNSTAAAGAGPEAGPGLGTGTGTGQAAAAQAGSGAPTLGDAGRSESRVSAALARAVAARARRAAVTRSSDDDSGSSGPDAPAPAVPAAAAPAAAVRATLLRRTPGASFVRGATAVSARDDGGAVTSSAAPAAVPAPAAGQTASAAAGASSALTTAGDRWQAGAAASASGPAARAGDGAATGSTGRAGAAGAARPAYARRTPRPQLSDSD